MPLPLGDTIAAIATAPGGAARGILRVSGPEAIACLARCFTAIDRSKLADLKRPQVMPGTLLLESDRQLPIDAYIWPGRKSYTREPAVELHTLGSPPLLAAALRTICAAGARLAEPGEFTLRAFLAGRLDLTQAEAVLGVIDAAGQTELRTALTQLAGGLAAPLASLRGNLLDLLAHLEAGLDFVEEEIEFISRDELSDTLAAAAAQTAQLAEQMTARGTAEGEIRVVLAGSPNVGKSSLLNALAGASTAIVSPQPGTTRDYVARRANLDGLACLLIDTAGVEDDSPERSISAAAQGMMSRQVSQAHLEILCLDSTRSLNDWERQGLVTSVDAERRLVTLTKCDEPRQTDYSGPAIVTSSRTGIGLSDLVRAIHERVASSEAHESPVVAGTSDRCRESLRLAAESLCRAQATAHASLGEELVAAEIRVALDEVGKVAGAVYTDDVLDRIFSRFCIGK